MKHHLSLIVGLAAGFSLLASSLAWADGAGRCIRHGGQRHSISLSGGHTLTGVSTHMLRHLLRNKQELGLTDDQMTKMRALALDADRAHIRAKADVMVSERELHALLRDEKTELAAIEAKVKEHEAFQATARIIGIKATRDLMGVLTPEQRAKQKALWEQYRHAGRGHMMRAEAVESTPDAAGEAGVGVSGIELSDLEADPSAG